MFMLWKLSRDWWAIALAIIFLAGVKAGFINQVPW